MSPDDVMRQAAPESAAVFRFESLPFVAAVEVDRFCDGCGYNLHTQAVRRDPRTAVLLCRCPECGRFHAVTDAITAGRLWLQRVAMLGLFLWIALLGIAGLGLAIGQGAITAFTLDELTFYAERKVKTASGNAPAGVTTYRSLYVVTAKPHYRQWRVLHAVSGLTSLGIGLTAGIALVIVCFHWRRWMYPVVTALWPFGVGAIVLVFWWSNAPHLARWSLPYIVGHALLCALGGIVGAGLGRPLARTAVRIFLPPRVRPALAFLWLADGKAPSVGAPSGGSSGGG